MFNEDEDDIEDFEEIEDETSDSLVNDIDHWNYRIFNGEDGFFTIGIVYYDKDENVIAWNDAELSPGGDTIEELISCMKLMMEATQKPVFTPPKENP